MNSLVRESHIDMLGRRVREVWISWARKQPDPKPSWLIPYDQMSERDREVDRQIGETLYRMGFDAGSRVPAPSWAAALIAAAKDVLEACHNGYTITGGIRRRIGAAVYEAENGHQETPASQAHAGDAAVDTAQAGLAAGAVGVVGAPEGDGGATAGQAEEARAVAHPWLTVFEQASADYWRAHGGAPQNEPPGNSCECQERALRCVWEAALNSIDQPAAVVDRLSTAIDHHTPPDREKLARGIAQAFGKISKENGWDQAADYVLSIWPKAAQATESRLSDDDLGRILNDELRSASPATWRTWDDYAKDDLGVAWRSDCKRTARRLYQIGLSDFCAAQARFDEQSSQISELSESLAEAERTLRCVDEHGELLPKQDWHECPLKAERDALQAKLDAVQPVSVERIASTLLAFVQYASSSRKNYQEDAREFAPEAAKMLGAVDPVRLHDLEVTATRAVEERDAAT